MGALGPGQGGCGLTRDSGSSGRCEGSGDEERLQWARQGAMAAVWAGAEERSEGSWTLEEKRPASLTAQWRRADQPPDGSDKNWWEKAGGLGWRGVLGPCGPRRGG